MKKLLAVVVTCTRDYIDHTNVVLKKGEYENELVMRVLNKLGLKQRVCQGCYDTYYRVEFYDSDYNRQICID
jgi:hypothetical protein